MNFYDFGVNELFSRGMFMEQATEVMDRVVSDSYNNSESALIDMRGRWKDDSEGYSPMLKNIIYAEIERFALQYIKEKCPEAWFRPIFDKDSPLRKEFEKQRK